MKRRYFLIGSCISIVVAVIAFFVWWIFLRETLLQAAQKLIRGVENRDARLLMGYMLEEEKELLGLNEEKLKLFLDRITAKRFQGFERYNEPTIFYSEASGILSLTQPYRRRDGREAAIMIQVAKTDEGIKAPTLFTSIFFSSLEYKWPKDKPRNSQIANRVLANAVKEILGELRKINIPGIVRNNPMGELKLRKWDELIERYEQLAEEKIN